MSKLFFRYAAMNAGKSTALLQVAYNYEERGMKVVLYTAAHDDRAGIGRIGSRLGITRDALTFNVDTKFVHGNLPDATACILIDEAQFLTGHQVTQLHKMAHSENIPVLCFGLRSDFRGQPFMGSISLLTLADDLEEMKTICACARKATMQIRLDDQGRRVKEGKQVEIGGNNRYRAVCPKCFYAEDEDSALDAPGLFG